jgi:hypothetical protein
MLPERAVIILVSTATLTSKHPKPTLRSRKSKKSTTHPHAESASKASKKVAKLNYAQEKKTLITNLAMLQLLVPMLLRNLSQSTAYKKAV